MKNSKLYYRPFYAAIFRFIGKRETKMAGLQSRAGYPGTGPCVSTTSDWTHSAGKLMPACLPICLSVCLSVCRVKTKNITDTKSIYVKLIWRILLFVLLHSKPHESTRSQDRKFWVVEINVSNKRNTALVLNKCNVVTTLMKETGHRY